MYNEAAEDYVYVIAGAGALEIIQSLKDKADDAKQELANYVAQYGVTVSWAGERINYDLVDENKMPAGWTYESSRAGRFLGPDWNSQDGKKIGDGIRRIRRKMDVQDEFNRVSHNLAPSVHLNNLKYSFEEIGGQTIIACPKQDEDDGGADAIVPPDSTVISYLDYMNLKEQANPTPVPQTREFENSYTPG